MPLGLLETYEIDPVRGCLPGADPRISLPSGLHHLGEVEADLPSLIRGGGLTEAVLDLRFVPLSGLDTATAERVFLSLSMLASAWVWHETLHDAAPQRDLPLTLSQPLVGLSERLQRDPMLSYTSLVMRNWRRIHGDRDVSPDNAAPLVSWLGGADEAWAFTAPIGVEVAAAPVLLAMKSAVFAVEAEDHAALSRALTTVAEGMANITVATEALHHWCAPDIYARRIQPFLQAWPEPGIDYGAGPHRFSAPSFCQSPVLHALDAGLGLLHPRGTAQYFSDMTRAMTAGHRRFIEDLRVVSRIRPAVQAGPSDLTSAYDAALDGLITHRRVEAKLARAYPGLADPDHLETAAKTAEAARHHTHTYAATTLLPAVV